MILDSNEFLKKNCLRVDPTNECALDVDSALKYIEYLKNEGKIILGGDVYEMDKINGELVPACDSWYLIDSDLSVENGYKYSKEFIMNYPKKDNIYFVIVASSIEKIKKRKEKGSNNNSLIKR